MTGSNGDAVRGDARPAQPVAPGTTGAAGAPRAQVVRNRRWWFWCVGVLFFGGEIGSLGFTAWMQRGKLDWALGRRPGGRGPVGGAAAGVPHAARAAAGVTARERPTRELRVERLEAVAAHVSPPPEQAALRALR